MSITYIGFAGRTTLMESVWRTDSLTHLFASATLFVFHFAALENEIVEDLSVCIAKVTQYFARERVDFPVGG